MLFGPGGNLSDKSGSIIGLTPITVDWKEKHMDDPQ